MDISFHIPITLYYFLVGIMGGFFFGMLVCSLRSPASGGTVE